MKYTALFAMASAATAAETSTDDADYLGTTLWAVEGLKGFQQGFYHEFYKEYLPEDEMHCISKDDVISMSHFYEKGTHYTEFLDPTKMSDDMTLLTDGGKLAADLMNCHFEQPALDIMSFCMKDDACTFTTLQANLKEDRGIFTIIG